MKNIVTVCSVVVLCMALVNSASAQSCCGSKAKAKANNASDKIVEAKDQVVYSAAGSSKCSAKKDAKIVILCGKCGEVKGTKECCAKDAVKCKKCGLNKGAPGCCKMTADGKNMVVCPKSGKLVACPSKSGKCDASAVKAACASGQLKCGKVKGCVPPACK